MLQINEPLFISICMPTYRRTAFIRQALESCLNQTYTHFEILVNDDTEDDSIKSIVESFKSEKIRYFRNKPPVGMLSKFNALIDLAKAEWMFFLCDDDYLEPDFLKTLSQHIKDYPSATLFRSRYRLVDEKGKELRLDNSYPLRTDPFKFLKDIFLPENRAPFKMNATGILFEKNRLKKLGKFQPFHRCWHIDRLAWAQLGAQGDSICEPTPLCNIRLHGGSVTSGLDRDYQTAIETDLRMKKISEELLNAKSKEAHSAEDIENLKAARKNLGDYIHRHLSKSFDHGFIAALDNKDINAPEAIRKLDQQMRELKVPFFKSIILYRILAYLPNSLRTPLLNQIRRRKIKT